MSDGGVPGQTPGPGSPPGAGASPVAPRTTPAPARRVSDILSTGPSAPRERGWWRLAVALSAFLLVPAMPLRALAPVQQTMILLVVAMAACTLVGWLLGGRLILAVAWTLLAVFAVSAPTAPGTPAFDRLTGGWALILGASFGLVCVFGRGRALFGRALAAVGIALGVALLATAGGTSLADLRGGVEAEMGARLQEIVTRLQATPEWRRLAAGPGTAATATQLEEWISGAAPTLTAVSPALLALESLMALALAWSLYHRVSRARLGPPLGSLREFKFNDQLVWGLIVGLVIVLLPNLAGIRAVGVNLLLFFGALYALRGFGVLSWMLGQEPLGMALLIGLALLFWPVLGPLALGLGIGDTWLDWRARAARRAA